VDAVATPGLLTCNQRHDWALQKNRGYGILWHQHWNRGHRGPLDTGGDYDFTNCRAIGQEPGVWAVIYEDEDASRYANAAAAAGRALDLAAEHLMFDIEYNGFDAGPIIEGCRAEGWTKEVHLTCLGAPESNPNGGFYDYGYDLDSFLATGGGIFPQAYWAAFPASGRHPNYAAAVCRDYYHGQLKVPLGRLNIMIWPNGYNTAEVERDLLLAADLGRQMSIFLAESTSEHAYDVLLPISLGETPQPPEPQPDSEVLEQLAQTAENVREEMRQMTATSPEVWITQNPGEAGDILRLCVYRAFGDHFGVRELKSHAGRAASGIAQNGVLAQDEL
jgi:hypothetical protein